MSEQVSTSFIVKGRKAVIDPRETCLALASLYRKCHLENPTARCFAVYDEGYRLEEGDLLTSTGTFICMNARSQSCGDRVVVAAQTSEGYHQILYEGYVGVQISVDGQIKSENI